VAQDEDWGFARDARNFAEYELVSHHISEDGNRCAREGFDDLAKTVSRVGSASHLSMNNKSKPHPFDSAQGGLCRKKRDKHRATPVLGMRGAQHAEH
jgi:hypothetical protein